jgi:hypothetical protein
MSELLPDASAAMLGRPGGWWHSRRAVRVPGRDLRDARDDHRRECREDDRMDADLPVTAAERLEALAARTTPGDWRITGLLATRPEIVAHRPDGGTEHVAEARAGSGAWIAALSPAVAGPLAALLRAAHPTAEAGELARVLLARLP